MPVFFFHLSLSSGVERDKVGVPFASIEEAYLNACETIPTLAADLLKEGHDLGRCAFLITDATGVPLLDVPFAELARPAAPTPLAGGDLPIHGHRACEVPSRDSVDATAAALASSRQALTASYHLLRMSKRHQFDPLQV